METPGTLSIVWDSNSKLTSLHTVRSIHGLAPRFKPNRVRVSFSAASMKSSNRESFLLTSTPFAVTGTSFIVTPNRNRRATHTSADFRPDTPVMLKRTFRHPFSSIPCDILNLPLVHDAQRGTLQKPSVQDT